MPKFATSKLSHCTLYYTTVDNEMIDIKTNTFDADIILHTYKHNKGSIVFTKPITQIKNRSFQYCEKLVSITISNSVTHIGDFAFSDCRLLTAIRIPSSVTSIGEEICYGCKSLRSVHIDNLSDWCKIDFKYGNNNPLRGADLYINDKKVTKLTIPSDIKEVKNYTFFGCTSLKNVSIPNNIFSIGNGAFANCKALEKVNIDHSVALMETHLLVTANRCVMLLCRIA